MEKIVVCDIGVIWDGTDRFKVYMHDNNVLKMKTLMEIYI